MTTRPLHVSAEQLVLNYQVHAGGSLEIEVLDASGQIVGVSQPIAGDEVDAAVAWKQKPNLVKEVVQLRFTIRNADVYSLRFR